MANNFERWLANGVESNAWSLVFLASAFSGPTLLGVWLALRSDCAGSSGDPVFAPFAPEPAIQDLYFHLSSNFARLGIALPLTGFYLVLRRLPNHKLARVVDAIVALLVTSVAALALAFVLARQSADQQRLLVQTRDSSVVALFNAYYCSARGVALCADQTVSIETLRGVFASERDDSAVATENVVRGCRYVLSELHDSTLHDDGAWAALRRQRAFLSSCNTSDEVDRWCGERLLEKAVGSATASARRDSDVSPDTAPSSVNDARFDEFAAAWRTRFEFDGILLGVACSVLLVHCVAWTRMLASDKREWPRVADAKKNE